jgi:hypothetical protein
MGQTAMPSDAGRPSITPDTKVGELLKHYPELEEVLVGLSPAFRALKNPVLRRTVAKVATLRQVAKVGNLALGTLVGRLREATGLPPLEVGAAVDVDPRPDWASPAAVVCSYDARPTIEHGGHPMERVMTELAELAPGQVYELLTPFVPAPLVDLARAKYLA